MEDNQIVECFWARNESALSAVSEKYERFCKAVARNIFGKEQSAEEFPSIFKSGHIKHTDMVEILTGHEIKVEFDRPTPLKIDGETIPDVTSYTVLSSILEKSRHTEAETAAGN